MRIGLGMPAYKRHELLRIALANLECVKYELRNEHELVVVVSCSPDDDPGIEDAAGAADVQVHVPNSPLGAKFNASVAELKGWNCDLIVSCGSDNLVVPDLFRMYARMVEFFDVIGLQDVYHYQPEGQWFSHWLGYGAHDLPNDDCKHRKGEPIGAGRCFSMRAMEALEWAPWEPHLEKNLDRPLWAKLDEHGLKNYACVHSSAANTPLMDIKIEPMITKRIKTNCDNDLGDVITWMRMHYDNSIAERVKAEWCE